MLVIKACLQLFRLAIARYVCQLGLFAVVQVGGRPLYCGVRSVVLPPNGPNSAVVRSVVLCLCV